MNWLDACGPYMAYEGLCLHLNDLNKPSTYLKLKRRVTDRLHVCTGKEHASKLKVTQDQFPTIYQSFYLDTSKYVEPVAPSSA